ncbi:MAG: glycosyltransferase family 39 protein [Myxococcota bacterium]|jgi:4-amino-4-deoxy-L-arabinose transferase-like glycosyltransferase
MKSGDYPWSHPVFRTVGYIVCGLALLLACDGAVSLFEKIRLKQYFLPFALAVAGTSVLFVIARFTRDAKRSRLRVYALIVLAVSVAARAAWVWAFDSFQASDFGSYLLCGSAPVQHKLAGLYAWLDICEELVRWERSVFYTYPIALVAGVSNNSIEYANIILITLSSLFLFLYVEKISNSRTALVALVIFGTQPELWYAVTLASHDVPAMFWLTLSLLAYESAGDRESGVARRVAWSVVLGVGVTLLYLQRQWDMPFIMAMAILGVVTFLRIMKNVDQNRKALAITLVLQLVMPLAIYAGAMEVEKKLTEGHREGVLSIFSRVATADIETDGSWYHRAKWMDYYRPAVPQDRLPELEKRKFLSEHLDSPPLTFRYWQIKNRTLGAPEGYLMFSTMGTEIYNFPTAVKRVNGIRLDMQSQAVLSWAFVLSLLVISRLLIWPWRRFPEGLAVTVLFSICLYLYIVLLGEAQSRYSIFMAVFIAFAAADFALCVTDGVRSGAQKRATRIPIRMAGLAAGGAACLLLALVVLYAGGYMSAGNNWGLRDMTGWKLDPGSAGATSTGGARMALVMIPAGRTGDASIERTYDCKECRKVSLFITDDYYPNLEFPNQQPIDEKLRINYRLFIDDAKVAEGTLLGTRFLSLDLPEGAAKAHSARISAWVEAKVAAPQVRKLGIRYMTLE